MVLKGGAVVAEGKCLCSGKDTRPRLYLSGHFAQVVQAVVPGLFHWRQSLEIVAADICMGHADAAMQLYRLLADKAQRLPQLQAGVIAHRALQLPLHVRDAASAARLPCCVR